jgi:RNase H-like domain found in reverse transcriptase
MFLKQAHTLAPLTALSGSKRSLLWTKECQSAFNAMKALIAKDTFLKYPDHNKCFNIYCNASELQLGTAIMQDGLPVAFYLRKLNAAQQNHTMGEKELLSIVQTLKEFCTMLYGCPKIHVFTNHKINTFHQLQTQCVLCWQLFEDYYLYLQYIKGESNSLADALSCLPFSGSDTETLGSLLFDPLHVPIQDPLHAFHSLAMDDKSPRLLH